MRRPYTTYKGRVNSKENDVQDDSGNFPDSYPCPFVENPSTGSGTSPLSLSKRAKDRFVWNALSKRFDRVDDQAL